MFLIEVQIPHFSDFVPKSQFGNGWPEWQQVGMDER
jgi:hypothetical protein